MEDISSISFTNKINIKIKKSAEVAATDFFHLLTLFTNSHWPQTGIHFFSGSPNGVEFEISSQIFYILSIFVLNYISITFYHIKDSRIPQEYVHQTLEQLILKLVFAVP